jgi:hypothetical protein
MLDTTVAVLPRVEKAPFPSAEAGTVLRDVSVNLLPGLAQWVLQAGDVGVCHGVACLPVAVAFISLAL